MQHSTTTGEVLEQLKKLPPNPKAFVSYTDKGWIPLSSHEFQEEVKYLALGLAKLGVKKGDRVGLMALPSARWTVADFAIMTLGAVSVPLFANISEDNFLFQIKQSEISTIFIGGEEQWKRCHEFKELFKHLLSLEYEYPPLGSLAYAEFLSQGKAYEKEHPGLFEKALRELSPDDLATIIYTSGSTGVPKGVEHTHRSMTALLSTTIFDWQRETDKYLSFLPLAHVFARSLNMILASWGVSIYYFNDVKNLGIAFEQVKPTLMIVVPRLLEKLYAKMEKKIGGLSGLKGMLAQWAFRLAHKKSTHFTSQLFHPLAELILYKKLRQSMGGALRVAISGGAPLNPSLYEFFLNLGVPLYEGWGLTETCPVTVNRVGKTKVGTVGLPIEKMSVKISPLGELLVKGEMMMRGYYKAPDLTREAFDSEGWLLTGDKGTIDAEGFVKIEGRLKELVKTSTGEMIAPVPIEQALCQHPLIDLAVVIAQNRKSASCLLVPDYEELKTWKKAHGLAQLEDQEVLKHVLFKKDIEEAITQINERLNHWEKIRDYRFVPHPFTIEGGELTPSMKVRRGFVENKYKELIESIYTEVE